MRELQSTVVIHSNQSEKETIETRTVVNYNHSHTLTILYYEVLRHFRVVTELARRRPAVLVKLKTDWFSHSDQESTEAVEKNVREHRASLQAALLDPSLIDAFDALERIERRRKAGKVFETANPKTETTPSSTKSGPTLKFFQFDMMTGGIVDEKAEKNITIHAKLWPKDYDLNNGDTLNYPGAFTQKNANNSFVAFLPTDKNVYEIQWGEIDQVALKVDIGKNETGLDISFQHIKVTGIDVNGNEVLLVDKSYENGHLTLGNTATILLPTKRPAPIPPPPGPTAEEIEDDVKRLQLLDHLEYHKAHYSRAILFGQAPADRAIYLASIQLPNGSSISDYIENQPLEIIGEYVAYACTEPSWNDLVNRKISDIPAEVPFDERLVTLPTRGVFAEAKLGHCNVSEEIDNTRFWDWQQSPIPHLAPEIAPIQGVVPESQQQNLLPTPFPQPLVNIVNPPAAPDPVGLSAAMKVLGTPNLFRDMSGQAEVADLLKKLSDNSISITEAANKAKEIQTKYKADLDKQQKDYDLGIYEAAAELEGKAVEAEAKRAAQAQTAKVESEARIAEANARKAEAEAAITHSQAATYFPKEDRDDIRRKAASTLNKPNKNVEIIFEMNHSITNQPLDGQFNFIVVGGPADEYGTFASSGGVSKALPLPLEAGEYAITVSGTRSKLPTAALSKITIPETGNHPAFNINLSESISPKEIELKGTGSFSVPANAKRVVLSVSAIEKDDGKVTIEVDYSRQQGVELQGEYELGAKLKDIELGKVSFNGKSIDIGTNGTKQSIPINYIYLTGGLSISQKLK